MKLTSLIVLGLAGLLAAGCSSTPTRVDTGPIKARTFTFMKAIERNQPGFADQNGQAHAAIHEAIAKNLTAKGLTQAEAGDVTVAYLVIVGNNVSTTAINDYFGYGRNPMPLQEKAQDTYTSGKTPYYFEAGTLLIDLLDSKTYALLKRGHATRAVLSDPSPEMRAANIQDGVDEILKDLRIEP